jgi:Protein of unknown function (DUF2568)
MLLNLALRFILELGALVALGYSGFQFGEGYLFKLLLGIGTPFCIAIIWGTFGSPAAPIPIQGTMRLLLEFIIFGLATLALYTVGQPALALIFVILAVLNRPLVFILDQ